MNKEKFNSVKHEIINVDGDEFTRKNPVAQAESVVMFEQVLTQLDEIEPIESPAVVCGKWGCVVS